MSSRHTPGARLLGAVASGGAAIVLFTAACTPAELVLRQPAINWDGLGVTTVGVETAAGSRSVAAALSKASSQAAELLSFALTESAFDVRPAGASAVLAVAVTKLAFVSPAADGSDDQLPIPGEPSQTEGSSSFGMGYVQPGGLAVRAVLDVRLLATGRAKPLWSRQAIGTVDYERPQTLFLRPGTASLDLRTVSRLRETAVRRALAQVVRELLPRYEYQELER